MPPTVPLSVVLALSVPRFIGFGWETFKKRPWFLVGATVLFVVIGWLAGFAVAFVSGILEMFLGPGLAAIVSFVGSFLVNSLIAMGWIAFFIKAHDDIAAVNVSNFWHPQHLLSYIAVTILYSLIVFLGFLLLVVPGIIAAIMFMFAPYLVVDKGLGPIVALKESARITKGNRLRVLALMGAVTLVSILGFVALVVGLLVAIPVVALAYVCAYRRLSAAADAAAQRQPLSGGEIALMIAGLIIPALLILGILSSVVLASLNSAREKGRAARAEADLKMLQLGLELYTDVYGSYPASLSDVVQDPNIMSGGSTIPVEDFLYTQRAGGETYRLCSIKPTASGIECVTSDDLEVPSPAQ